MEVDLDQSLKLKHQQNSRHSSHLTYTKHE